MSGPLSPEELSVEQRAAMTGALARIAPATGEDVRRALSDSWSVTGRVEARVPAIVRRLLDAEAEVARLRVALREAADMVAERDSEIGGWSARVAELEARLAHTDEPAAPARTAIFPDGRAAFLARKLGEEKAVVSATALNATTVDLHVRPASLDEWEWWQRRFHVEPRTATHQGLLATATGTFGTSLRVVLTGDGVGVLYAAERDQVGGAL